MKILDENNNILDGGAIDYDAGRLVPDTITIEHPAVEAVAERGHYVTVAEYPNGGKDVEWFVDVAGVAGREAWTEREEIRRFVPYTAAEMAARRGSSLTGRLRATDADVLDALDGIFSATTPTEFITALMAAAEQLKDVLSSRAALRAEIAALTAGKEE